MQLSKFQIDFILVKKKWRNGVMNTEDYDFFSCLESDRRLVMTDVRLSLRKSKAKAQRVLYDWSTFREDDELQQRFTVEVRNKFSVPCNEHMSAEEGSVEDWVITRYGNFIAAIAAANETLVLKRKIKFRENYSADPRVCMARQHLGASKRFN